MNGFIDTNVLIYGQQSGAKGDVARLTLARGGTISVQVLNEFTSVARRKLGYDWGEISEAIDDVLALFPSPLPLTFKTHSAALILARDHELSFYDALVVASAIEAGCDTLWTEDMQHTRTIGGLTIRNPFLEEAR